VDPGVELWIEKVGKDIIYVLKFDDVEKWQKFFKPELEAAMKTAEEVGGVCQWRTSSPICWAGLTPTWQ